MNTPDLSALEHERPRLVAIATRILGSAADADDVVQEAWMRLSVADGVDEPAAWLTTVVTRMCIDVLRKRTNRSRFEADAARTADHLVDRDPQDAAVLADRLGWAMQVVIDTLAPAERAAFVLHDVFGYPFDEVSQVLGRSPTAVRQLASRARRKVHGHPEPADGEIARAASRQVVQSFLDAARGGDVTSLLSLLSADASMLADRVGQRMGSPAAYHGADAVAARFDGAQGAAPALIDGELGAAWVAADRVRVAFVFHVDAGLVREVELIADPEVLAMMEILPC